MSYSTQGASNRQIYDCCAYAQTLQQSVDPLQYDLYFGAVENCNKCINKKAWFRQDKEIVDIESDLRNITRPLTRCDGYKYNPNCKTGPNCVSTFDNNAPRILSPSLCPIVYNNIPIQSNPGYSVPDPANVCLSKNDYRHAEETNTFEQWSRENNSILGNNSDPQNVFMFMNTCSNKPLYNGEQDNVNPYMLNVHNSASVTGSESRGIPFSRKNYDDQRQHQQYTNAHNMGETKLQAKRTQYRHNTSEAKLHAQRSKTRVNPNQLFNYDNESVYDSDGDYDLV